jgi:hypothetical protein
MPWKQESVVEQRLRFLLGVRNKEATISELCRRWCCSRLQLKGNQKVLPMS